MFCNKCGQKLTPESKFCSGCGAPAPSDDEQPTAAAEKPADIAPSSANNPQPQSPTIPPSTTNDDPNKYLPFIIAGGVVLAMIIFSAIALSLRKNNLDHNPANPGNNSSDNSGNNTAPNNNSSNAKPHHNYKVSSPARENHQKDLAFHDGEKYLRDLGFNEIDANQFAYDDYTVYDLDGYTARRTVYPDEFLDDVVKIVFKNDQIFLSEIRLVYLESDMNPDAVYDDLSRLMSAFNGYKLDRAKFQSALTEAENDPDSSLKYGNEVYFIGETGFDITVTISPATEYSKPYYSFEVEQGYK